MTSLFPFTASYPFLLPLLVFVAEMCVVTVGTIRIIFVARGMKRLAPVLGFIEVSIWLFAMGQIMQNLSDLNCYLAFAGGFTVGNFLGILIEKKVAIGNLLVQIITNKDAGELIANLRAAKYGVTQMDGHGATGPVQIVLTVIQRKELADVIALIQRFDSRAFYAVNDLQSATQGIFREARNPPVLGIHRWHTSRPRLTAYRAGPKISAESGNEQELARNCKVA
jgi:uncharacterized protein YebE (UPF0316 family)